MKKHLEAEVVVLDRLMYLLEERSVGHLVQHDGNFNDFVEELYKRLADHSRRLQADLAHM
jgi:signal-transduction protein with cAMP-binding, CBS, and nucleotidyltransferase domain